MRYALLALALTGCGLLPRTGTPTPAIPHHLVMDDVVLQNLFEIQAEYDRETMRCLTGYTVADTLYVNGAAPNWLTGADQSAVSFRGCTALGTVGWYHNHPGWHDDSGTFQSACWIEDLDVQTLRGLPNFLVAVVTCDDNYTLVWRWKDGQASHRASFASGERYRIPPTGRPD